MSLLLYAIAPAGTAVPPGLTGLDGSSVHRVPGGDLAAVVGGCRPPVEPRPETLLQYERIVERLMDEDTVLPARFGTVLAGESAVAQLLGERQEELVAGLERVSGAVELGVRADWTHPSDREPGSDTAPAPAADAPAGAAATAPAASSPGLDYMRERLERRRRARELAESIDAPLRGLARERSCRILARPESPVAAAYLVTRSRVDEFLARCRELGESVTGARIVCTGPWPPYSFVDPERS